MADKNIAVRYFSKGGHTKAVAEAIAGALGLEARDIAAPIEEPVDILFLGASVYWGGVNGAVKDYINALGKEKIGKAVIFSTSGMAERAYPQMSKLLSGAGIAVETENFYCRGQFMGMNKGRPNEDDLKAAAEFALKMASDDPEAVAAPEAGTEEEKADE
ncbi:MAG: flavodoxin [Clostridia bacterium]|nr:flavodoxin [Clostridia bacterium]